MEFGNRDSFPVLLAILKLEEDTVLVSPQPHPQILVLFFHMFNPSILQAPRSSLCVLVHLPYFLLKYKNTETPERNLGIPTLDP
jgi:hypothetical protein